MRGTFGSSYKSNAGENRNLKSIVYLFLKTQLEYHSDFCAMLRLAKVSVISEASLLTKETYV